MTDKPRVVVAMSGGVDSSVAAALLVSQGYDVIGMMLRLWSEPGSEADNRCCTPDAMALARRVSAKLGVPFYAVDAQEYFHNQVVNYFLDGYTQGVTPNPCLACNRHVRWEYLLNRALALGATHMATGHYARVSIDENGFAQLRQAVDLQKDQSYVLHVLRQEQLQRAAFPLGEYTKAEVRQMARDFGLPVAERSESQDLCFLAKGDYRGFLQRHAPQVENPGPILTQDGRQVGEHQGLAFYTIGQRKGLGIAASQPLYVLDKDLIQNALIVGTNDELGRQELETVGINWISGQPPGDPQRLDVKIRYRAQKAAALVTPLGDDKARVSFEQPVRDITPGQAAVFYEGELCLGGGLISQSLRSEKAGKI
jgi:tRNA-uridine 2-sulfurtransferase